MYVLPGDHAPGCNRDAVSSQRKSGAKLVLWRLLLTMDEEVGGVSAVQEEGD